MRRYFVLGCLAAAWAGAAFTAHAQEWRPAGADQRGQIAVQLGKPLPRSSTPSVAAPSTALPTLGAEARGQVSVGSTQSVKAIGLAQPRVVRASGFGHASAEEAYNCGVVSEGPPTGGFFGEPAGGLGSWVPTLPSGDYFRSYIEWQPFMSDQAFNSFVSPVSNPLYFEDPRSLTELRPLFIYQRFPGKYRTVTDLGSGTTRAFSGGDLQFFGLQARLALNERVSLVLNELGGISFNPDEAGPLGLSGGTSFAEIQFGPKFTFYRDDCTNTIAAFGVFFNIPAGEHKAFQDTGNGGVTPYISVGQKIGNFHLLSTFGYRFGFNNERSESFYLSAHLDYSIFDRIYPLVELNWYHWTRNGNRTGADFEGQDLLNLGANNVSGNDVLTLAAGVRFKITENIQAGIIYEFPISPRDDLLSYRIGADMIFRY